MSSTRNDIQVIACVLFFVFIFYFIQRKKYLIAVICAIAFANYVAINLNMGLLKETIPQPPAPTTPVPVQVVMETDYIARYVDWSCTTPLLVLTLLLKCNIKDPALYVLVLAIDILMVYTGYLGAVADTAEKRYWLFATSCFFYVTLFYLIFKLCYAFHPGLCLFLLVAWLIYPIVWILHRTPTINNDTYDSIIAVVDVFSKIGYGLLLPM